MLIIGVCRSIGSNIEVSELEYKIEKDQLDILNISQKIQVIKMNKEKLKYTAELTKQESLYKTVKGVDVPIVGACEVNSEDFWCFGIQREGFGVTVSHEGGSELKIGDRLLELDGTNVLKITREDWESLKSELNYPCRAVVIRAKTMSKDYCDKQGTDVNNLKEDIALIQSRLEQKLSDGRNTSTELEIVQKEKKAMLEENTRLHHRIAYLEEHTKDLQIGLKQVKLI